MRSSAFVFHGQIAALSLDPCGQTISPQFDSRIILSMTTETKTNVHQLPSIARLGWPSTDAARSGFGRQVLYALQIAANSLIGYLFSRLLAYHFGISELMSGFEIAFSVPFIILNISGFTFLHAIISSLFARMLANKSVRLDQVFSSVLNLMWLAGGSLMLLGFGFSGVLTELLAPGLSLAAKQYTETLVLWMLPLVLTLGTGTYFGAIFTAYQIPLTMEFTLLVSRLGFVALALTVLPEFTLIQASIGLLSFSVGALAIKWMILSRATGLKYKATLRFNLPEVNVVGRQAAVFFFVAAMAVLASSYIRRLATFDGPGTVAALSYGVSVVSPLGILLGKTFSFATAARYIALYERKEYASALKLIFRYTALSLGICGILVLLMNSWIYELISVLYGGGRFGIESVRETANITHTVLWSLPGIAISWVVMVPLMNRTTSHAGAVIYATCYLMQILLNYFLFPSLKRQMLIWSITLCASLQAAVGVGYIVFSLSKAMKTVAHDEV